jgi:hypothetical protein
VIDKIKYGKENTNSIRQNAVTEILNNTAPLKPRECNGVRGGKSILLIHC